MGGIQPPDLKLFSSHRCCRCSPWREEGDSASACTRARLLASLPGEGRSVWVSSAQGQAVSSATVFLFSLPLTRSVFAAQQPGLRPGVPVEQQREHQGGPGVRAPHAARQLRDEPGPGGRRVARSGGPRPGQGGTAAAFSVCLFCLGIAGDGRGGVWFLIPGAGRDASFPGGIRGASPALPGPAAASCRRGVSAVPPPPGQGWRERRRMRAGARGSRSQDSRESCASPSPCRGR